MLTSLLPSSLRGATVQDQSGAGTVLRLASPNERRCIVREDLGFYRSLLVGGIFNFKGTLPKLDSLHTYVPGLRKCVHEHPALSTIVERAETEAPIYVQVPTLDLRNHIEILDVATASGVKDELSHVEAALPAILDSQWPAGRPAWKIAVLPFEEENAGRSSGTGSCFIAFSFSHAVGDGISALAFHNTLLAALQSASDEVQDEHDIVITSPSHPIAIRFETPERLPISWSFFLSPFLAVYLPKFISSAFGLRVAATSINPGTWTATPVFYDPENHRTAVKILKIDAETLVHALTTCRKHGTKLTAFIHQLIVKALTQSLPADINIDNFVSQTAINLRSAAGVSDQEMGLFVSGYYDTHALQSSTESMWASARTMSDKLAFSSRTLQDQPIGLLRFLPNVRTWTIGKLGQERDSSYEVSNLLAFNPTLPKSTDTTRGQTTCSLEEMIFSQPANVVGAPLVFNIVSVKGGSLVCVVSWQIGAMSDIKANEQVFVEKVCHSIEESFHKIR